MFKEWSYENVQVGEEFTSTQLLITPELIEDYLYAVDNDDPLFAPDPESGEQLAPPTIAGNQVLSLRKEKYVVRGGLHAKQEFEFLRPIKAGMRVWSKGKIVDKYWRRGKGYVVTEFVTMDENGVELVRGRITHALVKTGR